MTDEEDYQYFQNKRPDRVYLSRSLEAVRQVPADQGEVKQLSRKFRIVSKIVESTESHQFIKDGREVALHITGGERQEIKATFYEDTRGVFTLTIQKYTRETGMPHRTYFTFNGPQISTLYNFLRNIEILPLQSQFSQKLDDRFVQELVLTHAQARSLVEQQPELLAELARNQVTAMDVAELGHRRTQLAEFGRLLEDDAHFETVRQQLGRNKRTEDVWQSFFEQNSWIFGYGLNYFFNSPLEGERLEQVVRGYDVAGSGKRVDALLRTRGIVSALVFGEIKTHRTPLLKPVSQAYRAECWQTSDELCGGIAQVQKTVQVTLENLHGRLESAAADGTPLESAFLYQPRSFLIVGSLSEFLTPSGVNRQKYSSFELFRRNIASPEIITFDELYERAKFIVANTQAAGGHAPPAPSQQRSRNAAP